MIKKKMAKPLIVIDVDSDGFYLARIDVHGTEFNTDSGYIVGEGNTVDIALGTALTRLGHAALRHLGSSK